MKITEIEATPLRIPNVSSKANDGAQETIIVKIHTDAGITGIGEVDSSPLAAKGAIDRYRRSRCITLHGEGGARSPVLSQLEPQL